MPISFKRFLLTIVFLGLSGQIAGAQDRNEVRFVKSVLSQLQDLSFKEDREYCGYIGLDRSGRLKSSVAYKGRMDSCDAQFPEDIDVVASFHTHGSFLEDAAAEVPSVNDMEADEEEGVDGYVSTPGGRLWYIDTTDMITFQLCGIGCLKKDPKFVQGVDGEVLQSYTYEELIERENEG